MPNRIKKTLMGIAALAALAVGGAAIAGAATSTSSTTTPSTPAAPQGGGPGGPGGGFTSANAPGTAAHENTEKAVTGADAEKAKAAALASVSGGKAGAVTRDFFGRGYEVAVTKSDGSTVTVRLDGSFKVQTHPGGGPGGPPPGQAGAGYGPPAGAPGNGYGQTN